MKKNRHKILFLTIFYLINISLISFGQVKQPLLVLQTGHITAIKNIEYSPDDAFLATSSDKIIIIWDLKREKQIKLLMGENDFIFNLKFSNNGKYIASSSFSGITVWDIKSGKIVGKDKSEGFTCPFVFSKDDKYITYINPFGGITVWEFLNNKIIQYINGTFQDAYLFSKIIKQREKLILKYEENRFGGNIEKQIQHILNIINYKLKKTDNEIFLKYESLWNPIVSILAGQNDSNVLYVNQTGLLKIRNIYTGTTMVRNILDDNFVYLTKYFDKTLSRKQYGDLLLNDHLINLIDSNTTHCDLSPLSNYLALSKENIINIKSFPDLNLISTLKFENTITKLKFNHSNSELTIGFSDGNILIFDLNTQKKTTLGPKIRNINALAFDSINNNIILGDAKGDILFWSLKNLNLEKIIKNDFPNYKLEYNPISKILFSYGFSVDDKSRMTLINSIDSIAKIDYENNILCADVNIFNEQMILCGYNQKYNLTKGKNVYEKSSKHHFVSVKSSFDVKYNAFGDSKGKVFIYDSLFNLYKKIKIPSFNKLSPKGDPPSFIMEMFLPGFKKINKIPAEIVFSPDNKYLLINTYIYTILWDLKNNKYVKAFEFSNPMYFSKNSKSIISGNEKGNICVFDVNNGQLIDSFSAHNGYVTDLKLINDTFLITSGTDGIVNLWNYKLKKRIASLIFLNNKEWIIITPDNYYKTSLVGSIDAVSFEQDFTLFDFDQFDVIYNRPDIVYDQIGNNSDSLIANYYSAYKKRIEKLGFSKELFIDSCHTPEIEIKNIKEIPKITEKSEIIIDIKGYDSKIKLIRLNVWINGVPINGIQGFDIKDRLQNEVFTQLKLDLMQGSNKIQVSCLNENFIESNKKTVEIMYEPKIETKPNLYILGIGASEFKNIKKLPNTDNDIRNFVAFFKTKEGDLYNHVFVDTFINQNVISDSILAKKVLFQNTTVNDVVLIYYSGHGSMTKSNDYYLLTYDTDPTDLSKNGLKYEKIENLLDGIPARKKLFLVNACFSGEYDKDVEVFRLMKETYPDLRRGTGSTVIASSYNDQPSFTNQINFGNNSAFGFAIQQTFESFIHISVKDFKYFLEDKVYKLSKEKQKPTFRSENLEMNFSLW